MTITDCLTALVVSGNGERCNELRSALRDCLLDKDESGRFLVEIHKFGKASDNEKYKDICRKVSKVAVPIIKDIHPYYFGNDLKKKDEA